MYRLAEPVGVAVGTGFVGGAGCIGGGGGGAEAKLLGDLRLELGQLIAGVGSRDVAVVGARVGHRDSRDM